MTVSELISSCCTKMIRFDLNIVFYGCIPCKISPNILNIKTFKCCWFKWLGDSSYILELRKRTQNRYMLTTDAWGNWIPGSFAYSYIKQINIELLLRINYEHYGESTYKKSPSPQAAQKSFKKKKYSLWFRLAFSWW